MGKKEMAANIVVKDNALINASYNLELVEQRLILLAIVEARESGKGVTANDPLTVHAESYINTFSVVRQTAYQALKDSCEALFARQFSFQEINEKGNVENVKSRWVSEIRYVETEAKVKIIFSPAIVPFITRLEEHFTQYELKQVATLKSKYAMRLYELLISWRSTGKTPIFDLSEFRNQLGVGVSEYKAMCDLKRYVIDLAVKQINEHTDITATYEQHKKGRTIVGFSFRFKTKPQKKQIQTEQRDKDTIDMFYNMSDAQIHTFGNQLARLHDLGHLAAVGESYDDLAVRIKDMLKDHEQQKQFHPYLKQLGFNPKGGSSAFN